MNLNKLLDPQNPRMALIWSFASSQYLFKKKNRKEYRELLSVDVTDVCGKLKEVMLGLPSKKMAYKAFFRASMVASGALRLHNKQMDILIDDTVKLLEAMRRERKALESLEENLDCITMEQMLDFDLGAAAPVTTTLPAAATAASRQQQINWGSLDGVTDWTLGPPRALTHQITVPDADVPPSTAVVAELEWLRGLEGSFEGPTLVDWEEELSREGSPKLAEEKPDESITEAPVDTAVAPVASKEPTLAKIVVEEVPDILPPLVEDLEAPAASESQAMPQATEEQPSQIELAPLEGRKEPHMQFRRVRHGRPVIDLSKYLSNDFIKIQIQSHLDTLRNRVSGFHYKTDGDFDDAFKGRICQPI
ncbi:uncharacterized protein LOC127009846 isoform X1 [Eriocheir sinensis]|uniref:uncharacterized protein LOC127009846 isoform X1 n=3 Tax=Eriocheir sinensis TaxID=95602 RepID=UPI0021C71E94|nr:uncharacterized protein LOC127009846 isoform X1 [Eriocheir sinensis]